MIFRFNDIVKDIEYRSRKVYISGIGENAVFGERSLGWYIILTENHLAVWVGSDRPDVAPGDIVKITIEKPVK